MKKRLSLLASFLLIVHTLFAQPAPKPYGMLPTERQLYWQETEMYSIIHFSMATFTDKEWGYGDEKPAIFNPSNFNAVQLLSAAKAAGIKGIVVVAKHHDGFCLWPTKTTAHNIANSPYKNGKGDIVKEYELACKKLGLKLGIYCSPWDRNNEYYGTDKYVKDVYREQLRELYSNYGPLFMSWHDGANGGDGYYGGKRELRKINKENYYGWEDTWKITRTMQPGAAIFGDAGPDVRWVGNEDGTAGDPCWETFTPHAAEGSIPTNGNVNYIESINGTRNGKFWIPAECDVALRPGWFYHKSQDGQSKTPYQLLRLYYESVGRGACLDLGLSPNAEGQLTSEDIGNLKAFGDILKATFVKNLAKGATFIPANIRGKNKLLYGAAKLIDNDRYSYWATDDKVKQADVTVDLAKPQTFNIIRFRENIKLGQRIDSVKVQAMIGGKWETIAHATSIGANRLIRLERNITAARLRFTIYAPVCIALSDFGLFKEPAHLTAPVIKKDKQGRVEIMTEAPVKALRYTTNGSQPGAQSALYSGPFEMPLGGTVKALAFEDGGKQSTVTTAVFDISKKGWKITDGEDAYPALMEAIDDNPLTFVTMKEQANGSAVLMVDMGQQHTIHSFTYLPRQDKRVEGIISGYTYMVSSDGSHWEIAAKGEFSNIRSSPVQQVVALEKPVTARYFKLIANTLISGSKPTIAELGVR
ncbi:hypothetical protein CKK33_14450 [Mucilaginibacter sp. MD40]|uniref:alpha-L-fucosidase n=1 Tax=Mucilaginibacter sp. MD40 TaxID=2029590 RepID=UPI000BACD3E9|nr:alpha-L-fucosidase [Mucilaginibacter sp. MD40]PAW94626.1 hypothetical protein CKK33_14450 [Mucilaginibacter sp. MD40]